MKIVRGKNIIQIYNLLCPAYVSWTLGAGGIIHFQKTSKLVPFNHSKEILAFLDPDTPTFPLDSQSNHLGNSPPFSCFTFHMVNEKYYKEREKIGKRTLKKLKNNGEEERKKSRGKRSGQNPQARCREMIRKKMSDFPNFSHKYFDKEFGIYQEGKQEKTKLSSRGPNNVGIQ